ncbi:MAG: GNAT family N-acetyltransferase [Bacteroidales bacterium]|nr:GNAT family N-acetyltransferase [Bacteroidales bacterium]
MEFELKNWDLKYAQDLVKTLSISEITNNLRDLPNPYTIKDAEEFITGMISANKNNVFSYAIINDSQFIGSIGAFRQNNIHCYTAEIGYYLHTEYWCKGIMTKAVTQLCDKIFSETDIIRIYATPFSYNIGSCRVLEKAGFNLEGVLRKNAFKNGRFLDMNIYSKIKE